MVHEGLSVEAGRSATMADAPQWAVGSSDGDAISDCELAVLIAASRQEDSPKVASSLDQQLRWPRATASRKVATSDPVTCDDNHEDLARDSQSDNQVQ